ncbi:glycoside hydrolase family 15 protein [Homoserinibacter sp. YIM 151385]|uniref:glycoside hydrolase family 15 protein n=1 Tax=Homoserinibacter sp. YIM 151385 TaxID=2985506 RepID=UPI0022F069A9|nr:glycoside hydrolase family 15 protein [Homoserinibacter sp. YIM 151385]WBU37607.1 glycoside hydrolase family 15 protein [Homoserinibacter sp. YIM 151385]
MAERSGTPAGPAIEDHAAIGDGRTVALVDLDGRIGWLPLPTLDRIPVFAALLDEERGGSIELRPVAQGATATRRYLPGTNVLETTWTTEGGVARVTDAMVTGIAGRLPWAELARQVEGVEGAVAMAWRVTPGTALRTRSPWIEPESDGSAVLRIGDLSIGITTESLGRQDHEDGAEGTSIGGRFRTSAGSVHTLALAATDGEPLHLPHPGNVRRGIERTAEAWRTWSREFAYEGPWREQVQRSALALKLLIHSPTGAIAAAATTSLPESPTGGKNWDYRFAWVRDLAYATESLVAFGLREETHAAISWMLRTIKAHGPEVEIFYELDGATPGEVVSYEVPGWRGLGPVVAGNPARDQLQLGVYGDLLGLVLSYVEEGNVLDVSTGRFLADLADRVCDDWRKPDAGMWELEQAQHHTSSKMGCWQALTAAIRLAEQGQIVDRAERWRAECERIAAWVGEHCWSEELGAYTMHPDTDELDASVLLHAPSGFDRGERMSRTIDAIRRELGSGEQLFRVSGMEAEEHPFTACAFWEAAALACVGRVDEAETRMDALVRMTNDVGLMAEMTTAEGAFWGNIPQALSHLALIDAAIVIREMRGEGAGR